jgi:hypothetical protein
MQRELKPPNHQSARAKEKKWDEDEDEGRKERVRRSTIGESAAWLACSPHFASRVRTDSLQSPKSAEVCARTLSRINSFIAIDRCAHRRPAQVLKVHEKITESSRSRHVLLPALHMHLGVVISLFAA